MLLGCGIPLLVTGRPQHGQPGLVRGRRVSHLRFVLCAQLHAFACLPFRALGLQVRLQKTLTELEKQFYGSSMAYDKAVAGGEPLEKVGGVGSGRPGPLGVA